jgi:hypothetical protein
VKSRRAGAADVHGGTLADSVEPFKGGYAACGILLVAHLLKSLFGFWIDRILNIYFAAAECQKKSYFFEGGKQSTEAMKVLYGQFCCEYMMSKEPDGMTWVSIRARVAVRLKLFDIAMSDVLY